ncbi:hypothetical protein V8C35DRAFT_16745 [Trichoderma chlorosporum]
MTDSLPFSNLFCLPFLLSRSLSFVLPTLIFLFLFLFYYFLRHLLCCVFLLSSPVRFVSAFFLYDVPFFRAKKTPSLLFFYTVSLCRVMLRCWSSLS